ncbi:MAG: imidazole glycerol phosphate synthase subunit HisH [Muribaculaceae bacterium]|nr:imidazole glycerol phosphate synthase subunit HisH [Muribaculaceae bacterium]
MIAIVKYNAGNVFSVTCALQRLGVDAVVTDDPDTLRAADKVIFPGVGEAAAAMGYLRDKGLDKVIAGLKQPVLGICIGMQLLCRHSEEGDVDGMGIFDTVVKRFDNSSCPQCKVPHMGWNTVEAVSDCRLVDDGVNGRHVYYVHSYYAEPCCHTEAVTHYIVPFSAVLHRDNFYATQFHPEKSGDVGELILRKFLEL